MGLNLRLGTAEALPTALKAAPEELEAIAQFNRAADGPAQNGFSRALGTGREVRLSNADLSRPTPFELAGGVVTRSTRGGLVWSGEVVVAGAWALRLHLDSPSLPAGSRVWVYAPGGAASEVSGARLARAVDRGELWTGITWGERAWLEVEVPAEGLGPGREARFVLDRVLEVVRFDPEGRPTAPSGPVAKHEHCFVDTICAKEDFAAAIADFERAVAMITYVKEGSGFLCSGALVADSDPLPHQRAFFMTARHCVDSQTVADTATTFFKRWRTSCGGGQATPETVEGAAFLVGSKNDDGDYSLLELDGLPPNPHFLPVNPDPGATATGKILSSVHHARGNPQLFSRHETIAECVGGQFYVSMQTLFGGTGPGSSGAAFVDQQGRLVGVVRGACRFAAGDISDGCDPGTYAFITRVSSIYHQIRDFLEAPPPPPQEGFVTDPDFPGFEFRVDITAGGQTIGGTKEPACLPETVCFSGALAGRSEVFVRVVGPRPNGLLWPILVKFTSSRVDVWIRQLGTGDLRHYMLEGAGPGDDTLPGLFDRDGFVP